MNKNLAAKNACRPIIRKAATSDAATIADLLTQLDYPVTVDFVRKKLLPLRKDPDEEIVVAELNGSVVGFIAIHFIPQIALPGSFARISYLSVDKNTRSKGIGGALVAHCEKLARKRRCDRIEVHCHERRKRAHEFYKSHGFNESPKYFFTSMKDG
jgi:GNAT superfamily N-acetyltransferase